MSRNGTVTHWKALHFSEGIKVRHLSSPVSESYLQNKSLQRLATQDEHYNSFLFAVSLCFISSREVEQSLSFSHPKVCGQKQIRGQRRPLSRNCQDLKRVTFFFKSTHVPGECKGELQNHCIKYLTAEEDCASLSAGFLYTATKGFSQPHTRLKEISGHWNIIHSLGRQPAHCKRSGFESLCFKGNMWEEGDGIFKWVSSVLN